MGKLPVNGAMVLLFKVEDAFNTGCLNSPDLNLLIILSIDKNINLLQIQTLNW
jgi:hypothetical protein